MYIYLFIPLEPEDLKSSSQTFPKQKSKGNMQKQNSKEGKGLFRQTQSEDQEDFKMADDTSTMKTSDSFQVRKELKELHRTTVLVVIQASYNPDYLFLYNML